jgi:hypothetical protein
VTPLYLSCPSVRLPRTILTNRNVVERVRARFTGDPEEWALMEVGIEGISRMNGPP